MDRNSFHFLYVNASSLAELALQLLAEQMLGEPQPSEASLTPQELNARVAASFEGMDLAALEKGDFDFSSLPAVTGDDPDTAVEPPAPVALSAEEAAAREGAIERYLRDAYAQGEKSRERVDIYHRQIDLPSLEAALARLPADLPPLTGALSAAEMSRWLQLYEAGDTALDDVVVEIRKLDMAD